MYVRDHCDSKFREHSTRQPMGPVNGGQVRKDVHLLVNNQYL